jgi:hypothetical protein
MKKSIIFLLSLACASTHAAAIENGQFNPAKETIELDVVYGGGCAKHDFFLAIQGCHPRTPLECDLLLLDRTNGDSCEAIIYKHISLPLKDNGLDMPKYINAQLTIHGDGSMVQINLTK